MTFLDVTVNAFDEEEAVSRVKKMDTDELLEYVRDHINNNGIDIYRTVRIR